MVYWMAEAPTLVVHGAVDKRIDPQVSLAVSSRLRVRSLQSGRKDSKRSGSVLRLSEDRSEEAVVPVRVAARSFIETRGSSRSLAGVLETLWTLAAQLDHRLLDRRSPRSAHRHRRGELRRQARDAAAVLADEVRVTMAVVSCPGERVAIDALRTGDHGGYTGCSGTCGLQSSNPDFRSTEVGMRVKSTARAGYGPMILPDG